MLYDTVQICGYAMSLYKRQNGYKKRLGNNADRSGGYVRRKTKRVVKREDTS